MDADDIGGLGKYICLSVEEVYRVIIYIICALILYNVCIFAVLNEYNIEYPLRAFFTLFFSFLPSSNLPPINPISNPIHHHHHPPPPPPRPRNTPTPPRQPSRRTRPIFLSLYDPVTSSYIRY